MRWRMASLGRRAMAMLWPSPFSFRGSARARRSARVLSAWLLLLPAAAALSAEVYRWRDANGTVHYSDRKPADFEVEQVAVKQHESMADGPAVQPSPVVSAVIPPAPPAAPPPISVLMYSRPGCGWCRKAEHYLEARGVPWRSIDITASAQAEREFKSLGGTGTPLIFIEGQRVAGFNVKRLDRLLRHYGR